ncbi:hypothetical protein VP01_58g4 [Puccinia sorghi]|uniref:Retroviral polymerase SH3-like domain-containing protein n=1 Tax=Puccinia sorghi TaxID=27349 RepID=A0A0L6UHT7_9BASI|nr:hypothetical protein VP01_58g4 [Puccinia sorghi]
MDSPYLRWHGRNPNLESLRPFGALTHSYIPKQRRLFKLNPTADSGIFLGYSNDFSTYKVYIPSLKRSVWTRNISCDENVYPGLKDFPEEESTNMENLMSNGNHQENQPTGTRVQTDSPIPQEETASDDATDEPSPTKAISSDISTSNILSVDRRVCILEDGH